MIDIIYGVGIGLVVVAGGIVGYMGDLWYLIPLSIAIMGVALCGISRDLLTAKKTGL